MLRVRKADGGLEPFDKGKVIRTCLKLRVGRREAERIAEEVKREAYDEIPTSRILELIYEKVRRVKPALEHAIDLREAISALRPKPDFEQYIRLTLESIGYRVEGNKVLEGRCVDHEIDGVAVKGGEVLLLEVKHHVNHHTYTGMDVFLEVWATLQDLMEGYELGLHRYGFTNALVACNTKISNHAERYARCKGLKYMGWRYPKAMGLEEIIEKHGLYPVTMLRGVERGLLDRLGDAGIVTLRQLIEIGAKGLRESLGIEGGKVEELVSKAKALLSR